MTSDPARSEAGLAVSASFATGLMVRVLAGLFAAGATLAALTLALPHSAQANELGLLAIVADAYLVAGILYWRSNTVSGAILPLALGWGSTLIALIAYFSAESPSPLIFFFLWVVLYASYFFTTAQTTVQIAYVGVAFGTLLILREPSSGILAWWLVGMGTLLVAAILIRSMRARGEMLIARLYDAARTDPLTKLANRRGLRELLDLELERARRGRTQASVLVGDIDGFKEFNDRLGSHAGDVALQRIALALDRGRRKFDGLARVGGEQFALVLPGTDESDACDIAESLRRGLGEEFASEKVPITISFGAATYPHHGETPGSLLHSADEALHAAKVNGRNRTVLYSADLGSSPRQDGESRDAVGERFVAVVLDLAEAVDLRFSGSARHSETVGRYTELIARELGFSEEQTQRVRLAGMLHDVGKVGVPDAVLNKPGSLTDEEFVLIKAHPALGAQILEHPTLADIREWVGAHHERPDGRGYPVGLAGESIPVEAQILAVADAYEAMTSDRAYRASIGREAAAAELERCSGTQFEPAVVEALINVLAGQEQRADLALARA